MKDILVEFTDYGAIIHKSPSVIEEKKDLPYCFFNPDLSKVSGVSPSYWVCTKDNEIIPASPEERKRRDEYHHGKPSENTASFKQTLDLLHQEILEDFEVSIKELSDDVESKIEDLHCVDKQIINTFDGKIIDINMSIDLITQTLSRVKDDINFKIKDLEKQNKILKIALIINVILTIILKVV